MKEKNKIKKLYKKIFTERILLKYGYYDIVKTKEKYDKSKNAEEDLNNLEYSDLITEYSKTNYLFTDIFNLDTLYDFVINNRNIFDNINDDNYNPNNSQETEPVYFSIPKNKYYRRQLKLPNIYSYLELMYYVLNHKEYFINKFMENDKSTSKYMGMFEFKYKVTEHIKKNKIKFHTKILQVDLSNFYHTIYTHTIPWIINGRSNSKLNKKANNFANNIDVLLENCQYGETHGVPTGNIITKLIMELYMCYFDEHMDNYHNKKLDYTRYVDDIAFPFSSEKEENDFLLAYRYTTREYELIPNDNKIKVEEYPFLHKRDKTNIFNYLDKINLKKSNLESIVSTIESFCSYCESEEADGNKGAIKCIFTVIQNKILSIKDKLLVKQIFSYYDPLSHFSLLKYLISISLQDSTLTNRFMSLAKGLINNGVDVPEIMKEYFTENKDELINRIEFYKKNKFDQELYQLLLYSVYFNINDFLDEKRLLDLIDDNIDDYSLCLIFILYYRNYYNLNLTKKYKILHKIEDLFEQIDQDYNDSQNQTFPVMAERHWFFRYFIYSLSKQNILDKKDINKCFRKVGSNTRGKKLRLNYNYALNPGNYNTAGKALTNFYLTLLEHNVNLVYLGKKNNFIYC